MLTAIIVTITLLVLIVVGLFVSFKVGVRMGLISRCEACGQYFLSKEGYTDLEYCYCLKCCSW